VGLINYLNVVYLRYCLNVWDVGGQKTIMSYWRNYFEQTNGLVWFADSSDIRRLDDCRAELHNLLKEEVCYYGISRPLNNGDELNFYNDQNGRGPVIDINE
jgi:GTPase SAR1 family protein